MLADFISSSRNPPNPSLFPKRVSTRLQLGPGFRAPTATQLYPSLRTSGWSISVRGPRAKMGQDAPRWAKMSQNCGFESTHNLSVRICIDSSFQQTAIYLSSATLSLALVLNLSMWLKDVEGIKVKLFPRVAHKIEGSSLSCFGSKLAPAA